MILFTIVTIVYDTRFNNNYNSLEIVYIYNSVYNYDNYITLEIGYAGSMWFNQ